MSCSIIALLKKDQLTGENYATWKSKLNMILVIADLRFVLMEECPPFPTKYASQSVRDAYDCWTKANDKAHLHILASISDILSKKHEIMVTARQIMDSLREMFGQPSIQIKQEANVAHSKRFAPSSSGSEKIQKRKEGKGRGPTIAVEGKGKAKVVIKGKCFHCNVDEHWKTNCPKYLVKKKEKEGATNHVCSSLQETSSFKQLEESEMTLMVGTGDVISARAVGDVKLFFGIKFMFLENLYIVPKIKRNLVFVSCLIEHMYSINFSMNEAFISKNGAKLEDNLYVLRPNEAKAVLNHEMFRTANTQNKRQRISPNNNTYLWHLRLDHINLDRIGRLVKNGLLNKLKDDSLPPCESCLEGKMTKRPFTGKDYRAKEPLELIHSDLCGPMNVKARGGFEYFISFIDDYSRYGYLYLMEHKYEALEKFKEYKTEVENLLSKKIKILRSDRGGEYMDLRFQDYMIEHGIQSQLSAPGTPQQNGVSERRNRTLLDMVRSMMSYAQLPSSFWGTPKKLEPRSRLCQFVGYPKERRGGLFFDPQENRVFVSTNTTFLEEDRMRDHKPRSKLVLCEATDESTRVVDEVDPSSRVDETTTSGQSHPSQSLRMPRRSGRIVSQPKRYLGLTETQVVIPDDGVEDPLSYKQTMNDVDKNQWVKAMDLEIESMYFNSVWELADLSEGVKPIGCKWIYKRKRDSVGKSIRILLSIATFYDYEIWQIDVKTAFLNGNLEESIFMSQPEGFDTTIKSYGFDQNVDEPCVYKKINKVKVAFLVLYVDDILLIGNNVGYLTDVKAWLAAQFQMKNLGEAQYVLGIQIIRDRKNKTLALSQATYIDKMLVRYSMQNSKKGLLPFRHGVHLSKEQCPKTPQEVEDMRRIPYASTVGSLMYVMLYTRLDIYYAVGIVSRYQSNPGFDH
ncbi:gag/pol protein [Cucumis melo var. makuwa]|uniref:Gag/pol protein n=1 Tax=Cucumis melo var. makuwa TaxID=1194695 RepID=A0A5A7VJG3_CUCMM|nr:gag/pol protein [Cucumis melo var. makuwa]